MKTKRLVAKLLIITLLITSLSFFSPAPVSAITTVTINGSSLGRTFEGIGGISSNGMTKLLAEYPVNQQQDILDFLFKPKFGASLQHLKVEIGSDANGTSGTEPSHMRSETDFDITRGVGLWIAQKAKTINPNIMLDAIRWGTPAWVTDDTKKFLYYKNFLQGARDVYGLEFDYISADENEGDFSRNWVVNTLRPGLNTNGFSNVKITAADSTTDWGIADLVSSDTALKNALYSINMHYRQDSPSNAQSSGLPIWNSEDLAPYRHKFSFSLDMAYRMIKSYTSGKMVKYEMHPAVEALYDNTPYSYKSIITATNPWTGHYDIEPGLWVTAQFTQFIEPGWVYLDSGCAHSTDTAYITLKNPSTNDYSIIILNRSTSDETYQFNLTGALKSGALKVWATSEQAQFIQKPSITPVSNAFTITVPAGSIYSLTTTTGQQKGQATYSNPTATDFTLPYTDNFESYTVGKQPKYTIDQSGAYEIASSGSGKYLRQVITADIKPVDWERRASPSPYTLLGGQEWKNYQVSADMRLESSEGYMMLGGRANFSPTGNVPAECYNLRIFYDGKWELRKAALVLDSGTLSSLSINTWYPVKLVFKDDNIKAYFNNTQISSVYDSEIPSGHIVLGSGYNYAGFDNLSVTAVDASTPTSCYRYEERDARVEYIGNWEESGSNAKNYTRTLLTSATTDHYLEFKFNGTAVSILGMISTDCGKADVYIDNVYQSTIDTYSATTKYRKSLFSAYGLSAGDHTVKLVIIGQKNSASTSTSIYVDAIETTGGTGLKALTHMPISSATLPTSTLLSEAFESNSAGVTPSGWTVTAAGSTSALVSDTFGASNKSVSFVDNNGSGIVSMSKSFTRQTQNMTVEYRYNAAVVGKWFRLYAKDGSTNGVEIYDSNVNGLCYRNSSATDVKIATISDNTWYTVKLDLDIRSKTFNAYVNGQLMLSNCPFRNSVSGIDSISFESGQSFVGTAYFDDIQVRIDDLVNENFNSQAAGNQPLGWQTTVPSGSTCTVQNVPSSSDKSLCLNDTHTSDAILVTKPLPFQSNIVVAEYKFKDSAIGTWSRFLLQNGSTSAVEIYNSDLKGLCYRNSQGKDIKIVDIVPETWYTIKIVANFTTDRFDVYINGNVVLTGCSFRNVVSGINNVKLGSGQTFTGTTYYDEVTIRKGN